jgi:hypothetical protein
MKTDEAREILCTMTFVDAKDPEGVQPPRIRPHRHSYIPLKPELPLNARNLVKLAQVTPPWASCIAICTKGRQFYVCGLFDQEIHHRNALNREGSSRFLRPGLFQLEVTGVGSLAIYDDRKLIATLNQNAVVRTFHDVLNAGPVAKILRRFSKDLQGEIHDLLAGQMPPQTIDAYWGQDARDLIAETLSRILLNIRRLRHGGAILLTPSERFDDLNVKYQLDYYKAERVIAQHIASSTLSFFTAETIQNEYLDREDIDEMPILLHLDDSVTLADVEDTTLAQLGCVNFISSLAGVDGLILISPGLTVRGFGVEITGKHDPAKVFVAGDTNASRARLKRIDLDQFGTRHRSMMRYCDKYKGSVGFVVSQDGDVRAMTKLPVGLVMWENIQLQEVDLELNDPSDNKSSATTRA